MPKLMYITLPMTRSSRLCLRRARSAKVATSRSQRICQKRRYATNMAKRLAPTNFFWSSYDGSSRRFLGATMAGRSSTP